MSSEELEFKIFVSSQRRISELEAALAERDAVICGLREELMAFTPEVLKRYGLYSGECAIWGYSGDALSSAPECPHKEKLSEQAALVEKMRDALLEVKASGVEQQDERLDYKTIQLSDSTSDMIDEALSLSAPDALAEVRAEAKKKANEIQ